MLLADNIHLYSPIRKGLQLFPMTPTLLRLGGCCRPTQALRLSGCYLRSSVGASKSSTVTYAKLPRHTHRASTKRTYYSTLSLSSTSVWQPLPLSKEEQQRHIIPIIGYRQRPPLLLSSNRHRPLSTSTNTGPDERSGRVPLKEPDDEPIDFTKLPHSSPEVQNLIEHQARKPQTSASLQTLMKTGRGEFLHKMAKHSQGAGGGYASVTVSPEDESEATPLVLLQVATFLRRELPIRLAHRIHDLSRVAYLQDMKSVQQVKDLYITSFLEILSVDKHPPSRERSEEWEEQFAKILENIYERHSSVLVQMARGAFELRAAIRKGALLSADDDGCDEGQKTSNEKDLQVGRDAVEFELMESTHAFLDRFYISRIGIRVLIGQYLSLRQPPVENYIGIICSKTSPYEIVKRAIDDAAFMCTRKYGDAPEVIISGRLDMTFPYVPTHLHYIMLELLKNSMRATVEYHGIDADYPPIKVVIADGSDNEDVIIKVSDEGGGIPRSNMKRIWSYLFTTADPEIQEGMVAFNENVDHSIDSPLAGLGYGLPISRSYARYFGGDLSIMSMEGYGTDCFVYLTRLGNTREPLPI